MTVIASAPGKVNLVLQVARPDDRGYHPLYSIFETLNIRETATVQVRPPAATDALVDGYPIVVTTTAPGAELPELADLDPKRHLAWRAAAALWDESKRRRNLPIPPGHVLDIEITKRIPIAGGMAGGSADAAATLVAVNEVLGLDLDDEYLHEIGRHLGADVPACLQGGISLGLGYGDHMTRLDGPDTPQHHWVMVTMDQGLSTPGVFKEFDLRGRGRSSLPTALLPQHLAAVGTADQVARILENDLQVTARELHPTLNLAWEAIEATDAVASILSGSGPTIAVLARDDAHAERLAGQLREKPGIAGTVVTSGPARPAEVEN